MSDKQFEKRGQAANEKKMPVSLLEEVSTSTNETTETVTSTDSEEPALGCETACGSAAMSSSAESDSDFGLDGRATGLLHNLQNMFSHILHLSDSGREEVPQLLDEVSFEGVARYIKNGKCKKIITMVGAGISTSAGIPDFRTPGSGLYDNLKQYNLPHPTAIFTIDFFKENPKPFFVLAKELYPGSFKPTVCHYFVKMLADKGLLLRHYTQNIDTLERIAGIPEEKLVEAHGTFQVSHCMQCQKAYTLPWMKEKIFADEIPRCMDQGCGGVVKPDIVFFGEGLPDHFATCVGKDFKKCDLLIIMGTSLVVQPFASLIERVPASIPRLYINLEKPSSDESMDMMEMMMGGCSWFRFDKEDNVRDVFKQATCDDGCLALAEMLGWQQELQRLVKKEHDRIDKETTAEKAKISKKPAQKESPDTKKSQEAKKADPTTTDEKPESKSGKT